MIKKPNKSFFFWKKRMFSLPKMHFDDLAVAFKSIYGLNGKMQNPGVSIGTEPTKRPKMMKVRYDGQTAKTNFGIVMFESDRILKSLTLGKDNVTGKDIKCHVSGYKKPL